MTTKIDTTGTATTEGEIESFSTDRIVIVGNFYPGDVIALRPGRRVAILTEADIDDYATIKPDECEQCEEMRDDVDTAEYQLRNAEERVKQLQDARSKIRAVLNDAIALTR